MRGPRQPARGAKKIAERPGLTADEVEELKEAFNLFDTEATGKIDPKYLHPITKDNSNRLCKASVSKQRTQLFST
jgi:Ca2+-binding EF-hand superfamily protein